MENEEDESGPNPLPDSPTPQLELELELDSAVPISGPESQCDSESVLARDSPPERLAGAALPPESEEVVDVISGEREGQVGFEIGAGVAGEEEEEEAVEKNRVVDGVEEETEVDDDGGVEGDTVVGSDGGFSELDGAGLVMAHNDGVVANVGEDMDIGRHVDAASSVLDTDTVFVTGEEGVEVGDDDNTEGIEVVENLNDTEPVDVGEDAHFANTGNEVAREIDEVGETEVADVGEDTHSAKTGNEMAHEPNEVGEDGHFNYIVNEMADEPDVVEETEVAEVGEDTHFANTGNEMVHEPVEVEETEVADVGEDAHFANTGNEMAHEQDVVGETEVADVGEDSHFANTSNEMDHAAEEAGEMEVVDAAEGVEEMEVVDAAEEAKVTKVVDAAEEVEEKEVADAAKEVEETEVADAAEEVEETEAAEGDEEIELADAGVEAEEIDVADDGEESEETEVADDAKEANETMLDDVAEEAEVADVAEDTVTEGAVKNGGKRKRGRIPKAATKVSKKKVEEDVCFICFDGGELVLCDRRGCPKAYHPACVNRDEAFFRAKGKWNCGWHLCSNCEKNAHYMCYTCTFSLCKACIKDAVILCVKGNKGFCEACMKTVLMIEQKEQENQEVAPVNFDDKSSFEYLFKDYWTDLKERLQLTADDITNAKNPWKGSHVHASKQASPDELYDATNDDGGSGSESLGNAEVILPKKRKPKKRMKSQAKVADSPSTPTVSRAGKAKDNSFEWASNELLEFVMHMRNGDKSVLSQFDVQALLLEYIKRNKLRDPRRKSQIICDQRLVNLFGKQRVGHFEMLKLIESHFHVREDSQADEFQESIVDTEAQSVADGSADAVVKAGKAKKRKRKNSRAPQSNLDDYAAIDMHNISLIYLKRSLLEDLIDDTDNFHDKVVGTFVRIRIAGAQKHDMYRLVQVVDTSKVAEPYKVGKRMTHIMMEVLNLNKTEVLSIDIISNQEFTEDECKRLRQSIKCGLINRLTVGDIQEKAMALQAVRVKDWFETEIVRLNHLCDRASDLGKKKQLRECFEKLQLLKSPEERQRRLEEIPEIHADPNMDPNYESEEAEGEADDKKQDNYLTPRGTAFGRKGREPISPRMGGSAPNDSWSGTRNYSSMNRESSRSMSIKGGLFTKGDDAGSSGEIVHKDAWNQGRDMETSLNSHEKPKTPAWNQGRDMETSLNSHEKPKTPSLSDAAFRNINSAASPGSFSVSPAASLSTSVSQPTLKVNETEKMWHYRDPSGKVQGPFSIVQLRKWNKSGYFPTELRIWKASENQDDSILLTDALAGKIQKESPVADNTPQKVQTMSSLHLSSYSGKPYGGENPHFDQNRVTLNPHGTLASSGRSTGGRWSPETENMSLKGVAAPSVEIPKLSASAGGLRSDYNRTGSTNLPSPTPTTPGGTVERAYENKWSPTSAPASSQQKSFPGNKGQNVMEYLGVSNVVAPSESQRVQVNSNLLQALNPPEVSLSTGADSKDVSSSLQNLIQSLSSHVPPAGARGWVSGVVANAETTPPGPVTPVAGSASQAWAGTPSPNSVQQPLYGHYGNAPSSSFGAGNHTTGGFPSSSFSGLPQSSDPWRPPISAQQPNNNMPSAVAHQQNNMPSVPAHQQNNMPPVAAHQQNNMPPVAPNTPWAGPIPANPNMGWMGPAPGNPSWLPLSGQGQPAGNANPGWAPPGQGPATGNTNPGWAPPGQGPAPGNSNPVWAPPGQGPRPVNGNNPGWVAPGQGPLPGNSNSGWNAPTGNSGNNRDSGYGGGKPWNNNNHRQSSFNNGGGGSRPRVCKFHENGHCRKGSSCNYMHT